ncbi:MAG TPA: type I-U CRISPR-associated RAMP protein Csb1/Cas7u [Kofleriaceae bacterium]|jgi:CRISPR-associated protein Csb1|nr:type I-U CRISPR-associated RAMP protein Csb1/Cas7u [Kofleriaceae bacterium]
MPTDLPASSRVLIEARLRPMQGTRFQPTGFPDIGAATYRLADGTEMLLVESPQSIANRLEAVCWDEAASELVAPLRGLPYVRVLQDGQFLTSSIQEAHRLNSVYIEKSDGFGRITEEIGHTEPMDRRKLARALLKLDPNSLVHGTFLESISGTLRLSRAVSGFIEASGVQVVASGGVKNDRVSAATDAEGGGGTAKDGFGNVPFHRDEYAAAQLVAYLNIDLSQLRSYGFDAHETRFLFVLTLWKVQRFLAEGLRLRTACDLDVVDIRVSRPDGWTLPALSVLEAEVHGLIEQLGASGAFARPPITEVSYSPAGGAAKKPKPGKKV